MEAFCDPRFLLLITIGVHKDFYRYQTAAIELGHLRKMLIRVDKGKTLSKDGEDLYRLGSCMKETFYCQYG